MRTALANRPAVLVPACEGGDLLVQFPELATTMMAPAIVNAAGGELALRSVGQCLIGRDCIGESVTAELGGCRGHCAGTTTTSIGMGNCHSTLQRLLRQLRGCC